MKNIFSQLNLTENARYVFKTLGGITISRNSDFATFGVGSVLASWELDVVEETGTFRERAWQGTREGELGGRRG
jgi:hypothetical protein